MSANSQPIPETPTVQLQPIVTTIITESCSLGVSEETDPLSGRTYRDLVIGYPNGLQYNIRFYDEHRRKLIGRGLLKATPKDERGVSSPSPLQDLARRLAEENAREGAE
jgi:hypothetical protein